MSVLLDANTLVYAADESCHQPPRSDVTPFR